MSSEAQPMETCFNYYYERNHNHHDAWFSSNEQRWINKIRKLKEQFPEKITIIKQPEDNDGTIYCKLPQDWLKINVPRGLRMTAEEKAVMAERLRKATAE